MPHEIFRMNGRAALLGAIAAAYPVIGYSAPAARVDFAVGNVTAVAPNGQSRSLTKGAQIGEGETINTNSGRAQLRFTDGAYVSLQPASEFRIDQYRFEGKADGKEKGFFSLLKGGLRTITGLVGRNNKQNYQISTTVATIGIRGTEYTIQYDNSIQGTVGEGEIDVCNGAGCLSVTNGESYYVQSQEIKPVLSNKRTDLPPPQPTNPPPNFVQGNNTDPAGNPLPGFVLTGTLNLDYVIANCACTTSAGSGTMVFDANGKLTSFVSLTSGVFAVSGVQMGGNDGFIAWGSFESPSITGQTAGNVTKPFVMGQFASLTDPMIAGTTATYTMIGATPVTNSSSTQVIGTLNSASLSVNFGVSAAAAATAGMNWTVNGSPLSVLLSGPFSSATTLLSGSCGNSCSVNATTALFGPGAIRAGMAYEIHDFINSISGAGAVAFAKK
jgi:FecR-like protein